MDGMVRDGSLLCTTGVGRGDAGGRRRRFSAARKAAIVAESFVAGTKVSEVAARHGLQASLLSTWRRLAMPVEQRCRTGRAIEPSPTTLDFVPVTVSKVGGPAGSPADTGSAQDMPSPSVPAPSLIEIVLGDASIRVVKGVDTATLSRVLAAVRGGGLDRDAGGAAGMGGDATDRFSPRRAWACRAGRASTLRRSIWGRDICIPFEANMIGSSCWRGTAAAWFSQRSGWRAASSSGHQWLMGRSVFHRRNWHCCSTDWHGRKQLPLS